MLVRIKEPAEESDVVGQFFLEIVRINVGNTTDPE
jgi:hypothetical protein